MVPVFTVFSCTEKQAFTPLFLKSAKETIQYKINESSSRNWRINPSLNPDRLEVESGEQVVQVHFTSGIDSLTFNIKEGDTIYFDVLYKQDTARTEIVGVPKNVFFTKDYIAANKGKFKVEIPEVHELANIMVAVSKVGQIDSNMVDMTTKYHQEVLDYFLKYKKHPAIDTINKYIVKPLDNDSYYYYYALKMNACGYLFDANHKIIDDGVIHNMGFDTPKNPFIQHANLFTDFSTKSNFRTFYKSHQQYYNNLIDTYKSLNPIDKMQVWLEEKFGFTYGSYVVLFSPLVGGAHATQKYKDNGFEQTFMYVCRSEYDERNSKTMDEIRNGRVVFTEIDHNFVNPVSDTYLNTINKAFADRSVWVDDSKSGATAYGTPYMVFNEYMTFAFYSLYCMDHFSEDDYEAYVPKMESFMTEYRGFEKFKRFNRKMMQLYSDTPQISVKDLYEKMFIWSEIVNTEL
ncbi:MAG: DUF4932 domain-containing protein [Flavicella sp.]